MEAQRFKNYQLSGEAGRRVKEEFENIYKKLQTANFKFFNKEPNKSEVTEKGIALALVSGSVYLYTKINGILKKIQLT